MRYYIATTDLIPYPAQADEGYTKLQVIARVHREAKEDARLFGGDYTDYLKYYTILKYDGRKKPGYQYTEAKELYTAL